MVIDNCKHSFQKLSEIVLPLYMEEMRGKIASPIHMSMFAKKGVGKATALKMLNLQKDFPGCYVLIEKKVPIYVGISRGVIQRLIQHVKGRTHYDATLAYRLASENKIHGLQREAAMRDPEFKNEFNRAKDYLKSLDVAFIEIENDLELYLFEVYCSMDLKTVKWNTFRTH